MTCPYCGFRFKLLAVGSTEPGVPIPLERLPMAPALCERCGEISLLIRGEPLRKIEPDELASLKRSPSYREFLKPLQKQIQERRRKEAN